MYTSEKLAVKTHKMTDLSGITVTPGILPAPLRESLDGAVDRIGAKIAESVRIDTTHFVCTEGRGDQWQRASEMNIPIVRPEWIEGCEREGRIVGVRGYYLDANPKLRQVGQGVGMQQQQSPRPQQFQRTDSTQTIPYRQQPQQPQHQPSEPLTPSAAPPSSKLPPETPTSPRPSSSSSSNEHGPPIPEKDTPALQSRPSTEVSDADADEEEASRAEKSQAPTTHPEVSEESITPTSRDEEAGDDGKSFSTVQL